MKIVGAHRKGHDDLTNQALTWNINTGKRKPVRPKITWRRGFLCELKEEKLSSFSNASTAAKFKEKWRTFVCVAYALEKKR